MAEKNNLKHVLDGTNFDDLKELRFGRKAARELGVKSPVAEAKITKQDIRKTSKSMKLPTWNKGSFACLASRFPHGQRLAESELKKIEKLEDFLKSQGFRQLRARSHNRLARIEVGEKELPSFINRALRKRVIRRFKKAGFDYITLDIEGYKVGTINTI